MICVVNALSARLGGGQTYLHNLLNHIDCFSENQIYILASKSLSIPDDPRIVRIKIKWPTDNPFFRTLWERYFLHHVLSKIRADILFCPGGLINSGPSDNWKTVTMSQNMIPFTPEIRSMYPIGYMRLRNWLLERAMLKSIKNADLVIFISGFAKNVIQKYVGDQTINSITIPHGLTGHFKIPSGVVLPRPKWLPKGEYLLYVSLFEVYKNHLQVVRGYHKLKQLRATPEKLILAGLNSLPSGDIVRAEIERLGLGDDVILPGNIPYNDLPAVYHHAKVNIFASECENCPNILLEALGAGRPALVSNCEPMPEFGGDAVIYFDPSSPEDFACKLSQFIDNPEEMDLLAEKARKQSKLFDWGKTADQTWTAIRTLHESGKV